MQQGGGTSPPGFPTERRSLKLFHTVNQVTLVSKETGSQYLAQNKSTGLKPEIQLGNLETVHQEVIQQVPAFLFEPGDLGPRPRTFVGGGFQYPLSPISVTHMLAHMGPTTSEYIPYSDQFPKEE